MSTKTGNDYRDSIVDIGGSVPPLLNYSLYSTAGGTLTGIFVDVNGAQIGASASYTISAATGTTLTALYNTANSLTAGTKLPANLLGFVGACSAAVTVGLGGLVDGTLIANVAYPVTITAAAAFSMGRVPNSLVAATSSGGGGGGGASTIADGADVAEGSTADVAYVSGSGTVVAILKGVFAKLASLLITHPVSSGHITNDTAISVGTASTSLLAAGAYRLVIISNDSVNILYVRTDGSAAAANTGIRVNANGGNLFLENVTPDQQIFGYAMGAASNILVSHAA